jgi:hypothetical protein
MSIDNEKELQNLKKRSTGTAIFTTDMGTGKQGNITPLGTTRGVSETGDAAQPQGSNKAQSAGAPGSAGMVGSKRWMAAHTDPQGNITGDTDNFS